MSDAAERSTKALIAESGHVRELIEKVNAQFLLTDLKIGMTFLHIARSTLNPETARRNIVNARRALNMVTHRIALLRASREKMVEIEANLKLLKNELREFE